MMNYKKHLSPIKINSYFGIAVLIFAVLGCGEKKAPHPKAVASVDGKIFTSNELDNIKKTHFFKDSEKKDIVNQWIEEQVFLREAEDKGITKQVEFVTLSNESKAEIAKALLLKNFFDSFNVEVNENEIRNYYNNHRGEFISKDDIYYLRTATSKDFSVALRFRESAISQNWKEAMQRNFTDISFDTKIPIKIDKIPAGEFRNTLLSIDSQKISPVVKSNHGEYIVFQIVAKLKKGSLLKLEDVRNEIIQRIRLQKKIIEYEKYKEKLYSKHKIEIYGDLNE